MGLTGTHPPPDTADNPSVGWPALITPPIVPAELRLICTLAPEAIDAVAHRVVELLQEVNHADNG